MEQDYQREIKGLTEGRVLMDSPMKRFTSMRVGGPADALIFPKNVDELRRIVLHAKKRRIPTFIMGKGTNLVVRDRGIRGWVINLTQGMKRVQREGDRVEAEAGASLQRVVRYSAQRDLAGLEAFLGIPGTVGGGLAMNAGAWGVEMKDVVLSVSFLNEEGETIDVSRAGLKFSYRRLEFPFSWIILRGRFQLKREAREQIIERMNAYWEMRQKRHPLEWPSAGSIFKNPKEGPAGRWIEEVGMKGFRVGQAMVSDLHANFIINLGKATARDIEDLIERVERQVYEEKGISLEREVKVVGE